MSWRVLGVTAVVVVVNGLVGFGLAYLLSRELRMALVVGGGVAQIGEFSFILASLGIALGLFSDAGRDLILAAALISITLNPFLFRGLAWLQSRLAPQEWPRPADDSGSTRPVSPAPRPAARGRSLR